VRKKLILSKMETQEYDANVKRLMAAGVIPPIENPLRQTPRLTLDRVGGPVDSFVYGLPTRGYGIVVWVRIVALKSGIKLSGCQVTPQRWDDADIDVLDAPEALRYYRAIGGAEYPKENVLNNWISSNRCLNIGKVLEGVVIAQSHRSLPAWCVNGISIEADLRLCDQLDNVYPLKVELRVMRDAECRVERPRRTGLFGPAVNASVDGVYVEKSDLSGHDDISRKNPSMPATK
jgi:hypothetical protein